MDPLNSQPRPSTSPAAVVEAPTLKEALRLVRQRHGDEARVIRSRTLTRRQAGGLGQQKVVEVLVEPPATPSRRDRGPAGPAAGLDRPWRDLAGEIATEVERIEGLVRQIARDQALAERPAAPPRNRLARVLIDAGASPGVVARHCDRCRAETGAGEDDRRALLDYLGRNLPTGRGDWQEMGGTHVFLGATGCGRTEMVLAVAAHLAAADRQVLVLSLLPRHGGEVRRLQAAAAEHGYDAAVIQKPRQLAKARQHLAQYEVVLVDAPDFTTTTMPGQAELEREIVDDPSFHRHFVFPLDRDLRDIDALMKRAQDWNCDWLAVSRVDQTRLRGKLLDLVDQLPRPVSVLGDPEWPHGEPRLATPGRLLDLILGGVRRRATAEG